MELCSVRYARMGTHCKSPLGTGSYCEKSRNGGHQLCGVPLDEILLYEDLEWGAIVPGVPQDRVFPMVCTSFSGHYHNSVFTYLFASPTTWQGLIEQVKCLLLSLLYSYCLSQYLARKRC